jgi:dihydrofolate synthase/folylpolyglutamate synthase
VLDERGPGTLIFSCLRDKPVTEMAQILFPLFGRAILAPIHAARAATMEELLAAARATGTPAVVAESVSSAIELAEDDGPGSVIVVSGSVYLVGEVRGILLGSVEEKR